MQAEAAKDRTYSGSIHTDPEQWLIEAIPHSAVDAICLELAVRDALDNGGLGRCGTYVVRVHEALATVNNDGYLLVLGSPMRLKVLIAKARARKSQYLADPEAAFIREWLDGDTAESK